MVKLYRGGSIPQPSFYKFALEGCNHQVILTPQEIVERTVESRYGIAANEGASHQNYLVCPRCSGEAGVPKDGDYCKNSVVHRVVMATPLYTNQMHNYEMQHQEQKAT